MQTAIDWRIHLCGHECWESRRETGFLPYLCNAHTHGMEKYHHPDFQVVLNLSIPEICRILNTLSLMVKRGYRFHDGELVYSIYEDCPVRLSEFTESGRKVLRVVIPDRYNQYPENPECDHPYWFQQFETEKLRHYPPYPARTLPWRPCSDAMETLEKGPIRLMTIRRIPHQRKDSNMDKEQNRNQIIRKDAKGCFVESLNDAFGLGKIHLVFSAYDLGRPAGQRQTNMIPIYIDIGEFLELCRKLISGELRYLMQSKKSKNDTTPLFQVLGGTSAQRLAQQGRARADGKSLSRVFQLICGAKTDFLLIASSGPGDTNEKGLIVPRFGTHPENHVTVSMTFEAFSELLLMTKEHYTAWLTSRYIADGAGRARTISAPVQTFKRGTDESELKPIAGPFSPGHIF